ncbi:MAG: ABC transporter substrate-binding protein, partial [Acetatifactor sp.]|nr:ABC transporter substrate-binding protein [Acetatifactor sp.]
GHGSSDEGGEGEDSGRSGGHGSSDEGSEGKGGDDSSESTGTTPTHGNEVSFEAIVALNPEYIFVMDRDSAISATGAQLAQEIMENELIMKTDAYQNGNLVILENPGIWYLAEGGITSLGIMLSDLENALLD